MKRNSIERSFVYAGTYTAKGSRGIYRFLFNENTGALEPDGMAAEMPNPTFLRLHPNGRLLYAVSEVRDFGVRKHGAVNAFAVARETGALTLLNSQPSGGAGPCHLSVDRTGRVVLVANYAGGSVALLPIQTDGRLSEATDVVQHQGSSIDPERQAGPHAHSITPSPDNRFALAADLGLDRIIVYRLDLAAGRLPPNDPPWTATKPGAGPRHLSFHPTLPLVYVITELDNTVVTFEWDAARGALRELDAASTLPAGFASATTAAEVQCDPAGRFLYGSNRGHDSLAVFRIDEGSGRLSPVTHVSTLGSNPRHFAILPSGRWLLAANQDGDSIVVFRRDPTTGRLTPTGHTATVSMPVCLLTLM